MRITATWEPLRGADDEMPHFSRLASRKIPCRVNRRYRVLFIVLLFIVPRKASETGSGLVGELLRLTFILRKSCATRQNYPNSGANVGNQGL